MIYMDIINWPVFIKYKIVQLINVNVSPIYIYIYS